jgi:DtxR family Mn-dependent transcriptional regulator
MEVWKEFGENVITHSAAHHLLAILELTAERGYSRVTDVAKHLKITTGSASTNLKSLKQKGLVVEDDNRFLALSPEGQKLTEAIVQRREILQTFFINVLGVKQEQAEIDACKTEHLLSIETTQKMSKFSADWIKSH